MLGIHSSYLPGNALNFACSSQDIYYNYLTARKIWDEYSEKVKAVKYVVIDMYDWTYFNFEALMTGVTVDYFIRSGFDCPKALDEKEYKSVSLTWDEINRFLIEIREASEQEKCLLHVFFDNLVEHDENAYSAYPFRDKNANLLIFCTKGILK